MRNDARLLVTLSSLPVSPSEPCSYLEDRLARYQAFLWDPEQGRLPGSAYQDLMDNRFRRSGRVFYRPVCSGCGSCIPIRIDVESFAPSKSQRRVLRRNQDVRVRWATPEITDAKRALYRRYMEGRHGGSDSDPDTLDRFLYDSPTDTIEATYWLNGDLIAAGICDVTPQSLSTVYFYFEPGTARRSLGTFSALVEIEAARKMGLACYYLGYWVPGCRKMEYKAALGPHQLLSGSGWAPAGGSGSGQAPGGPLR
ncbi:MAG: arginyltransferase [Acidobacteria bacterium]|nr:arginyltransferase [Acidobacteriota bacterium]